MLRQCATDHDAHGPSKKGRGLFNQGSGLGREPRSSQDSKVGGHFSRGGQQAVRQGGDFPFWVGFRVQDSGFRT